MTRLTAPLTRPLTGRGGGIVPSGFPDFVSMTPSNALSNSVNHTIYMPGIVNAGDLLLVSTMNEVGATHSAPTGWTVRANANDPGGGGTRQYLFTKVAVGNEAGTTVNFVTAAQCLVYAVCLRISNVYVAGTYWANSTGKIMASAAITPNSLTPAWGPLDTLWISIAAGYYDSHCDQYPLPDNQSTPNEGYGAYSMYISTKKEHTATIVPAQIKFPSTQYGSVFTIGLRSP